jgi:hypothetical protein
MSAAESKNVYQWRNVYQCVYFRVLFVLFLVEMITQLTCLLGLGYLPAAQAILVLKVTLIFSFIINVVCTIIVGIIAIAGNGSLAGNESFLGIPLSLIIAVDSGITFGLMMILMARILYSPSAGGVFIFITAIVCKLNKKIAKNPLIIVIGFTVQKRQALSHDTQRRVMRESLSFDPIPCTEDATTVSELSSESSPVFQLLERMIVLLKSMIERFEHVETQIILIKPPLHDRLYYYNSNDKLLPWIFLFSHPLKHFFQLVRRKMDQDWASVWAGEWVFASMQLLE